ncbi:MAG: MBL fold metallo-hydrolase [Deltaproteobacteria bacterium]|nr:MBL fold metallo-hydrolase [Deltaproteobacteria bacterium]
MKVILLGTGGPRPDPHRQGPSLAVQVDSTCLLFDAGRGVTIQLMRAGISVSCVNPVFITHHHFDHIGNLGDLILSSWNSGRKTPLSIYGPEGTEAIVRVLLNEVYNKDIFFRQKEAQVTGVELADIRKIVDTKDISSGLVFADKGIKVYCEFVEHGHTLGIPVEDWKCLAYRIEVKGKSLTISGDAVDCRGLASLAVNTDALVMCCYLSKKEMGDREGDLIGEHILACTPQVGRIASRAKAKKLILTHMREKNNDLVKDVVDEIESDYEGEVIPGKDLMTISV